MKSELTFGYYDRTKFEGDIHWNNVLAQFMFGVKLDDVKINGKRLNICKDRPKGCLITFDSGASLMAMPSFAFKQLVR